jgi:TRAP-type C4-dicarboxylate transport system permease small subunit
VQIARRILRGVDILCDVLALSALVAMVVVVTWQVFGRYVLQASPRWSSEIALLLLAWLGLLGIAIGIRERSHIAVSLITDRLPSALSRSLGGLVYALMAAFGGYFVVEGIQLTEFASHNTMPATGLPTSVQYAAIPVSGILICVYALAHLFGVSTPRYPSNGTAR